MLMFRTTKLGARFIFKTCLFSWGILHKISSNADNSNNAFIVNYDGNVNNNNVNNNNGVRPRPLYSSSDYKIKVL